MKRRLPPLNALRAFEAAARLGRMSAAADELSVTPGAISRQVKQLEQQLNVQLFEGSKNKPVLTPSARNLLPVLSSAFDQVDAAVNAIRDTNRTVLDVACFSTFMVKWLIPRLFNFNTRYPDIEIRLQSTNRAEDPSEERVDVVIAVEKIKNKSSTVLPLFPERLGPVLTQPMAATLALREPCDLEGKLLLQSSGRIDAWSMWAAAIGCTAPKPLGQTFDHYYFALEAAMGGLGIAVAPWHLVANEVLSGRLLAPFGFCPSGLSYVVKRIPGFNPGVGVFCEWLQEQSEEFEAHGISHSFGQ
jgi:LysR family glycine cleavage system transcriptional activator